MRLKLPENVKLIIDILRRHGFEAYVVGGCVRDSIMARKPSDWDITTAARPEEVKKIFRRTVDTGLQHGTVTVLINGEGYEVTTFRIDGNYSDGRHPDQVMFTPSLKEDLRRRDFTVNAMAYNDKVGLVDLYGGMDDLQHHVIRCVGDPNERFEEDALRIFRAVRFAAQLGFTIDEPTRNAISAHAKNLEKVSAERIQVELVKLLVSPNPAAFREVYSTGMTAVFMPEFDVCMETPQNSKHHCYSVGEHILHALPLVPPDKVLRLTMLLHDIGKPWSKMTDSKGVDHFKGHGDKSADMARSILKRLKFDNDTINKVVRLVRYHDVRPEPNPGEVRRAIHEVGKDLFADYLAVQYADNCAKSNYKREMKLKRVEDVNREYIKILGRRDPLTLKELAIDGSDLLKMDIRGREIGDILESALMMVLDDPERNDKELLLSYARQFHEQKMSGE